MTRTTALMILVASVFSLSWASSLATVGAEAESPIVPPPTSTVAVVAASSRNLLRGADPAGKPLDEESAGPYSVCYQIFEGLCMVPCSRFPVCDTGGCCAGTWECMVYQTDCSPIDIGFKISRVNETDCPWTWSCCL